jgi:hypothetical protein
MQHAEQMQCLGMVRVNLQNLVIASLGVMKRTSLVRTPRTP